MYFQSLTNCSPGHVSHLLYRNLSHYKVKQETNTFNGLDSEGLKQTEVTDRRITNFLNPFMENYIRKYVELWHFFWVQTMKILDILFDIQLLKLAADNRHLIWRGHTLSPKSWWSPLGLFTIMLIIHMLLGQWGRSSLKFPLTEHMQEHGDSLQHCITVFSTLAELLYSCLTSCTKLSTRAGGTGLHCF